MNWLGKLASFLVAVGAFIMPSCIASAQQVWFAMRGMEYDWKGVHGHDDWERLFLRSQPDWPASLRDVRVVQVTTQTLSSISDDDLRKLVNQLGKRGIALAVEMLAQAYTQNCGEGAEGFATPASTASIAEKIKRVGGDLKLAAMDEPLWFGHYNKGRGQCQSSVAEVAQRVAANITEYKRRFPALAVGDIEPVPALTTRKEWQSVYRQWMAEFRAAVGENLAFLHIDIDWNAPNWQNGVTDAMGFAREIALPTGIIYNASARVKDDNEWLERAYRHVEEIEDGLRSVPDHAIFQSWVRFPTRGVSDQSSRGEDYLVERYDQRRLRNRGR